MHITAVNRSAGSGARPSVSFCASQDLASCMEVGFLQQRTIIALREVIAPAGRVVATKGCISRLVLPGSGTA